MNTYRAIWPIVRMRSMQSLVAEAMTDLPALLIRDHLQRTDSPRWRILPSCDVPGSGNMTDFTLVGEMPVETRSRPHDEADDLADRLRRGPGSTLKGVDLHIVADLVADGMGAPAIAKRMGISKNTAGKRIARARAAGLIPAIAQKPA